MYAKLIISFLVASCGLVVLSNATAPTKCIQCNSGVKGEEWCEDTKQVLDKANTDSALCNNGPEGASKTGVGCRKILQYVDDVDEGKLRVIRECAYSGQDVNGQKRTGNKGIRLFYYQCSDKNNCNSASSLTVTFGVVVAAVALSLRNLNQ